MATAANFACPVTPLEIELGRVCAFNVYHIMPLDDPECMFEQRTYAFDYASNRKQTNGSSATQDHAQNGHARDSHEKGFKTKLLSPFQDALMAAMYKRPTMYDLIKEGKRSAPIGEIAQVVRTKNVSTSSCVCISQG